MSECFNFEILYRPAFLVDSDTEHLKLWQEAFGGLEGTQLLRTFMYFSKMCFESVLPTRTLYTSMKMSKMFTYMTFKLWEIDVPETVQQIADHPTDDISKDFAHEDLQ